MMRVFRPLRVLALVLVLFSLISLVLTQPVNAQSQACPGAKLSPNVPHEVALQGDKPQQKDFDCFSWQSFVALNWPAAYYYNGQPDRGLSLGQEGFQGLVAWETNIQPSKLFLPDGDDPCKGLLPEQCWNKLRRSGFQLSMTSKAGGFLDGQFQAVPNAWLTDQNGNLTRYQILLNQDEFNYILRNKLYNGVVQKAFNQNVNMPPGSNETTVGPIEFKAAWKILTSAEKDSGKYFVHENAEISDTQVNPENGYPDPNGKYMTCGDEGSRCFRDVGLVGLHIAHKVKNFPQWIWSTFEHINNAPIDGQVDPNIKYSFYNQNCGLDPKCQPNTNPRKIKNIDGTIGIPVSTPNQVTRVTGYEGGDLLLPKDVNDQWHQLVQGTVWVNYELISTQWPTNPTSEEDPTGKPKPRYLANTVMETYNQTPDPNTEDSTPSSCIGCHVYGATLSGKKADFSFLFSKAKPN